MAGRRSDHTPTRLPDQLFYTLTNASQDTFKRNLRGKHHAEYTQVNRDQRRVNFAGESVHTIHPAQESESDIARRIAIKKAEEATQKAEEATQKAKEFLATPASKTSKQKASTIEAQDTAPTAKPKTAHQFGADFFSGISNFISSIMPQNAPSTPNQSQQLPNTESSEKKSRGVYRVLCDGSLAELSQPQNPAPETSVEKKQEMEKPATKKSEAGITMEKGKSKQLAQQYREVDERRKNEEYEQLAQQEKAENVKRFLNCASEFAYSYKYNPNFLRIANSRELHYMHENNEYKFKLDNNNNLHVYKLNQQSNQYGEYFVSGNKNLVNFYTAKVNEIQEKIILFKQKQKPWVDIVETEGGFNIIDRLKKSILGEGFNKNILRESEMDREIRHRYDQENTINYLYNNLFRKGGDKGGGKGRQ